MSELINRPEYLNQLIQNKDVDLVKIVTGIRRCGKSSLLDLFHQHLLNHGIADSNIIHMNLESLRYRDLKDYLVFYDYVSERIAKSGKTYLIFDELQVIEHWEKAIESFRLDFDVDIYITGSNAYLLSTEFSTLLSGRYVEIHMLPLSFKEFLDFYEFAPDISIEEKFQKYLQFTFYKQWNKLKAYAHSSGISFQRSKKHAGPGRNLLHGHPAQHSSAKHAIQSGIASQAHAVSVLQYWQYHFS